MMRRLLSMGALFVVLALAGCAGDMDLRLRQQREEIYNQVQRQYNELRQTQNVLQKEIDELKAAHGKDLMEANKTLLDHQRQIFSDRDVLNETSKRVYFLESIITARTPVASQIKDTFVTFVRDDEVSISAGSVSGVRTGDLFSIYKKNEKIGALRIDIVEVNSSRGQITEKTEPVSIGDRVEPEKKKKEAKEEGEQAEVPTKD
jgi:hypothetical protein